MDSPNACLDVLSGVSNNELSSKKIPTIYRLFEKIWRLMLVIYSTCYLAVVFFIWAVQWFGEFDDTESPVPLLHLATMCQQNNLFLIHIKSLYRINSSVSMFFPDNYTQ